MNDIRLVATDLDGTFLRNDRSISDQNLKALEELARTGVTTVAATGRNLRKVEEVIPPGVPFDYIVFSSGAGIYDWMEKKHIFKKNISRKPAVTLTRHFTEKDLSFHAFFPVPHNHCLWYHRGSDHCEEFERFFLFHNSWASELPVNHCFSGGLSQFLIIIREDRNKFEQLKNEIGEICSEVRVIRASSPVTPGYIWIEVFHKKVSKGNGILHVCRLRGIDPDKTLSIGNDYNDIDMLNLTAFSFLTDNAPEEIKSHYMTIPSNEENGFAHIVSGLLGKTGRESG